MVIEDDDCWSDAVIQQTSTTNVRKAQSDKTAQGEEPGGSTRMQQGSLPTQSREEIPVEPHAKIMAVTDQNGGQPPDRQCNWVDTLSPAELEQLQVEDDVVGRLRQWKIDGQKPGRQRLLEEGELTRTLCEQWSKLKVKEGILYRQKQAQGEGGTIDQVVVPQQLRKGIFQQVHASRAGGHLGDNRTTDSIRRRFYWPRIKSDVSLWCKKCTVCARIKAGPRFKAPMQYVPTGNKFDRVYMDILGELPETDRGNKYILVVTDGFTKWTQALPLPDQKAQTVADALMTHVISLFGVPKQIHTDQGRNFESGLFQELCTLLGIEKSRTTPYRPQSDGQTERFNRTLQQMLKSYVNEAQNDWDDHLPYVVMAYRATRHDSTNLTPNLMFLGTENLLPVDLTMGPLPQGDRTCPVEYVEWLKGTITRAHEAARIALKKSTVKQKRGYDFKAKPTRYAIGDYVWRWYPPSANRKLGIGWTGPYKVVGCPTNINCEIQRNRGDRKNRVHVDHLKKYLGGIPPGWSDSETDSDNANDTTPTNEVANDSEPDSVPQAEGPSDDDRDTHSPDSEASIPCNLRRSSRKRHSPKRLDL